MRITNLLLLVLLLALGGCSVPSYSLVNPVDQPGLDFSQGRWLLSDEGSGYNYQQLYQLAEKDFGKYLGDRLSRVSVTKGLMLQKKIPFNPNRSLIKEMYDGTHYDYLINIKCRTVKDDIGGTVDVNAKGNTLADERINRVSLEVYDLKRGEIIYSQTAQGVTTRQTNATSNVNLYRSNGGMIVGSYNRIFKDIRGKSRK